MAPSAAVAFCACTQAPPSTAEESTGTVLAADTQQCAAETIVAAPDRASNPALVARREGILDLVYTASDSSIRHRAFDGTQGAGRWSGVDNLGGALAAKPGVAAWGFFSTHEDRLDIVGPSPDHKLYHAWWLPDDPGGSETIADNVQSGGAASSWGANRLDMFYIGADGALHHRNGATELTVGSGLIGDPATISWGNNRIDVFARDATNHLWHAIYTGAWTVQPTLASDLASSPTVASWGLGRLDVFWRDSKSSLRHRSLVDGNGWSPTAEDLGGRAISGDPAAASWGSGRVDVIVEDAETHQLVQRTWLGTNKTPLVAVGCPASCNAGLVAWNLDNNSQHVCSGGGTYHLFKGHCPHVHNTGDKSDCKEVDVTTQQTNSCNWATTFTTKHFSGIRHDKTHCSFQYDPKGTRVKHCTKVTSWSCSEEPSQAVADYQTPYYNGFGKNVKVANQDSHCNYDLVNVPVMQVDQPNPQLCGTTPITTPTWPSCTTYADDNSCGDIPVVTHTEMDTSFPPTQASGGPDPSSENCLTDESHPISPSTEAADVVAKYNRLKALLAQANQNNLVQGDNRAEARRLVQEIKLLFEMFGYDLSPAQQADAIKLYFDVSDPSDTPLCGTSFVPPDAPDCDVDAATLTNIDETLAFCARMSSGHVSARMWRLPSVVNTCIDVASSIAQLRPPFLNNGGTDDGSAVNASTDPLDACKFKAYRDAYDTWVTTPLGARFNDPRDPRLQSDHGEIQSRMYVMDRWYRAIEAMYPYVAAEGLNADAVRKAAWTHAQEMEASFWRGVYRNVFPQATPAAGDAGLVDAAGVIDGGFDGGNKSSSFNADSFAAFMQNALQADQIVLKLAFSSYVGKAAPDADGTPPLQSAPLLLLTADALEGMSQRIRDVGIYHDMGCAYVGCTKGIDSEIVHLVELMADLADPNALPLALNVAHNAKDANAQPLVRPDWLAVYDVIASNAGHTALETALKDALRASDPWSYADHEGLLENGGADGMPDPARHLASVLQGARTAYKTYKLTGLFSPSARNRLAAGIQKDDINDLRANINQRAIALQNGAAAYNASVAQMATQVIQETAIDAKLTQSGDQINQKLLAVHKIASDYAGLSNSLEINQKDFGKFASSYAAATAFDGNGLVQSKAYTPVSISAAGAKAVGPIVPGLPISAIAALTITNPGQDDPAVSNKGTVVTIQVNPGDKWAPTCALQRAQLPNPNALGAIGIQTSQLTGPEGYMVNYSNGVFTATKNDTATTLSTDDTQAFEAKICGGLHAQVTAFTPFASASVYSDVSTCGSTGLSQRSDSSKSQGSSDGTELRTTANFASGMRLESTPFPGAPVGALLAVVTKKGHPDIITDLRVVQAPATTIVLSDDSDLELVVNDIKDPSCITNTINALSVSVGTARHAGDTLAWVNGAIAQLAHDIAASGDSYVAQGELLPEQEAAIRSQAWTNVVAQCKASIGASLCDVSKLPGSVSNFINAFIDREIEAIALEVAILSIQRQFQVVELDIRQIVDDYNASSEEGRIAELLPKWTLRNLDTELLRAQASQLVEAVTYDLYPVLQLRFAPILPNIQNDQVLKNALMLLVNAKWDAPVNDLATQAAAAATALYDKTMTIQSDYPTIKQKFVAFSFPKVGIQSTTWLHVGEDDPRRQTVWDAIQGGNHIATLHVQPEDLYRANGGPASLLCIDDVPVIRDLAIVLTGGLVDTTTENNLNGRSFDVASSASTTMTFATAPLFDANSNLFSQGGPLLFQLKSTDPGWGTLQTQVLASTNPGDVMNKYNAIRGDSTTHTNGRGLSPFADFTVDFSALYDDANGFGGSYFLDDADQVVIAMELEYRQVGAGRSLSWIHTCAPAAAQP